MLAPRETADETGKKGTPAILPLDIWKLDYNNYINMLNKYKYYLLTTPSLTIHLSLGEGPETGEEENHYANTTL